MGKLQNLHLELNEQRQAERTSVEITTGALISVNFTHTVDENTKTLLKDCVMLSIT